ncbi:HAD family hydrolase [Paenibacillus sp. V4I7]|uniref:HAD family hydrolase n=1 Tax=Paenibacillus sp. V4I7 TaxID=3042307 RepID=UPI00278AA453|nr:HAD family hydrolase [Paenibacillus sp. V4I7]MDQ0901347.1 FMN phosphatase YigB (HAD superfamily) [Paenibacillus sp. V4I7]
MLEVPHTSISFTDLHLWKKDRFLSGLIGDIDAISLLSLDIFDTLLFRTCANPSDVFVLVAEKAHRIGCLKASISPAAFKEMRIRAENNARDRQAAVTGFGEVTLELIYAEMPEGVCIRDKMAQIEVETEAEVCYVNPHVASLLAACKSKQIPVALLSDMYLSSEQLRWILSSSGLDLLSVDTLLVSSEEHEGKSSGHLFARLKELYPQLESHEIVHIGDNIAADVEGASKEGIRSVHYNVVPEHFGSLHHWEYVRHGHVLPEWKSLRKLAEASDMTVGMGELDRVFYKLGTSVIGPFLQALCEWVIDQCVDEGIRTVHPLMREAYLLAPMLESAARIRGVDLQIKPIYVSRQATFLAGLESFGDDELTLLLGIHGLKISELFEVLDICEESDHFHFEAFLEERIETCKYIVGENGSSIYDQIGGFLRSAPIQTKILASVKRHRQLFVSYLKQEFGSPERLVTVDIGFHGTIQKSLEKIVSLAGHKPQMTHLLAVGANRLDELSMRGMDIRSMLRSGSGGSDEGKRIARTPAFLEELMMGDFGSTLRYAEGELGQIRPITAELKRPDKEYAMKRACQEGALAFQGYYAYLLQQKEGRLQRASLQPVEWSKPLHRVLDMPRPEEARLLGDLTHQDNFCTEYIAPICEDVAEEWFEQGPEAFLNTCNYGPSILNANWPQGLVTIRFAYYLYTFYLRLQDGFGSQVMLFETIQKVKEDGVCVIHLYGTGAFAEQALKMAWFHGLQIRYWIDPHIGLDAAPWGQFAYVTLEQVRDGGIKAEKGAGTGTGTGNASHAFLIATLSEMKAYKNHILHVYEGSEVTPIFYELLP